MVGGNEYPAKLQANPMNAKILLAALLTTGASLPAAPIWKSSIAPLIPAGIPGKAAADSVVALRSAELVSNRTVELAGRP